MASQILSCLRLPPSPDISKKQAFRSSELSLGSVLIVPRAVGRLLSGSSWDLAVKLVLSGTEAVPLWGSGNEAV